MPSLSQITAALFLMAAVAAWGWAVLTEIGIANPGRPRIAGDPVQRLEAALPAIGAFDAYHINHENPFVPWQQRQREVAAATKPKTTSTGKPVPRPEVPAPPVLPTIEPGGPGMPVATALVGHGGRIQVLADLPNGGRQWVSPGDQIDGWRLIGVEEGNQIVWQEEASQQIVRLPLAPATSGLAPGEARPAPTPKTPAPKTKNQDDDAAKDQNAKDGPAPKTRAKSKHPATEDDHPVASTEKPAKKTAPTTKKPAKDAAHESDAGTAPTTKAPKKSAKPSTTEPAEPAAPAEPAPPKRAPRNQTL